MHKFILYQFPLRSCSSVTVNALLELGFEFEDRVINILKDEQYQESYLKIHPFGKVPALLVDGKILIENVAILLFLDSLKPNILFPKSDDLFQRATYTSDLVWCTGTLHPSIRRMRMPKRYTDGDVSGIQKKGLETTKSILNVIEERLTDNRWWYGQNWSIMDVYVNWGVMTAFSTELIDLNKYPAIKAHNGHVRSQPTFLAALDRQTKAKNNAGLEFPERLTWKTEFN